MRFFTRFLKFICPCWMVLPVIVVAFWFAGSRMSLFNMHIVPSPGLVYDTFLRMVISGNLFLNTLSSLSRVFSGFLLASFLAVVLGFLLIHFSRLFQFLDPTLDFIKHIPPLAVISFLILCFGIGEIPKVFVVFLASFFPIFLNLHQGIMECDKKLLEVGRVAGMKKSKITRKIVVPSLVPFLMVGLRLGLCYGWRSLVGAEMIVASSGIGYMIMEGRELSQSDVLCVGILTLGVVGVFFDRLFFHLTSVFVPYRGSGGFYGSIG